MAIRDKIRANAQPFLEPGEQIQAVIPAQTTSQYFALISYWIIIFSNAYRNIIVTDRRILITQGGRFSLTPVKSVIAVVPRATAIGPTTGALWYKTESLGERLYINRRFFKDVETADALLGAGGVPPQGAYPPPVPAPGQQPGAYQPPPPPPGS